VKPATHAFSASCVSIIGRAEREKGLATVAAALKSIKK
jgi:hypothetical protein